MVYGCPIEAFGHDVKQGIDALFTACLILILIRVYSCPQGESSLRERRCPGVFAVQGFESVIQERLVPA